MNVSIYFITDTIVSIVDTRLRLPTETPLKEMQQECNFNFITNGWAIGSPHVGGLATFARTTAYPNNT